MQNEERYKMIYFTKDQAQLLEDTYFILQDIDGNFSKVMQELLLQIFLCTEEVIKEDNSYRHYVWALRLINKETGRIIDGNVLEKAFVKAERTRHEQEEKSAKDKS